MEYKEKLESLLGIENGNIKLGDLAAKEIYTMYKKDRNYFERVKKSISKIACNPNHCEKLSYARTGYISKHVGSKVIIFRYNDGNVYIENIDQHDKAYGLK